MLKLGFLTFILFITHNCCCQADLFFKTETRTLNMPKMMASMNMDIDTYTKGDKMKIVYGPDKSDGSSIYLYEGEINNRFWISLILTLLGFFPGVIYALILILGNY